MKTCKGCGAFYYNICPYCGYDGKEDSEINKMFVSLKILGDRNNVNVHYGEPKKETFTIVGDRQNMSITAEYINIGVMGDRNNVNVDKKVSYFSTVRGDRNSIN